MEMIDISDKPRSDDEIAKAWGVVKDVMVKKQKEMMQIPQLFLEMMVIKNALEELMQRRNQEKSNE